MEALITGSQYRVPRTVEYWIRGFEEKGLAALREGLRRRKGRPVDLRDTMIAGIVVARHAILATRNVFHFEDLSVPVVNPWLV